jgi:hypothetical protein
VNCVMLLLRTFINEIHVTGNEFYVNFLKSVLKLQVLRYFTEEFGCYEEHNPVLDTK